MDRCGKASKEQVRQYMLRQQAEHKAPPSIEEIRRQLGWTLCAAQRVSKQHH